MTLAELIDEVEEKTHFGKGNILHLIMENWGGRVTYTPTQCRLLVMHIDHMRKKEREMMNRMAPSRYQIK